MLILALNIVVFIVFNSFMLLGKDELGKYKRSGKRLRYFDAQINSRSLQRPIKTIAGASDQLNPAAKQRSKVA